MKTINQFLGLLGVLLAFSACNEDPTYFTLEDQPDAMHVKASASELVLSKAQEEEAAITFSWDEAQSPVESYDSITYALRLYATDTKSDNHTDYIPLGSKRELSFTHKELNAIVARWVPAGTPVSVTAQVVGTVNNEVRYVKPESSTVEFRVTGYEKNPTYLYLHMKDEATGTERVERLTQRQLGSGIYEGTYSLSPCGYYFTTSATDAYPAYGQAEGEKMSYVTEGEVRSFTNTVNGTRTFIVDTNNDFMDCRVKNIVQLPTPETIRLCGNGCSVGWDPGSAEGLFTIENPRYPYIFSWTGDFNADGELKVNTGTGWGDQFFFAPVEKADPAVDHRLYNFRSQGAGGDVKWVVRSSGRYKFSLCLDADDMWTSFEPVQ
ncbi:MAG: SusE domain-containing protein [Prevotella sp.]|nr:SusE domain-containing protein [Prevotella sp.]